MKRLYLLRHAEAASINGGSDFDRLLTVKGLSDAHTLGAKMKAKQYQPDFIFCSPALRTTQTMQALLKALSDVPKDQPRSIYESGRDELLRTLHGADDAYESILMVAHNPSIHQLAFDLSRDTGTLVHQLSTGYPPATLSVLDCNVQSWRGLTGGENILVDLLLAD